MKDIFSILNTIIFILIIMIVIDCSNNMNNNKTVIQNVADYIHDDFVYIDSIFNFKNN